MYIIVCLLGLFAALPHAPTKNMLTLPSDVCSWRLADPGCHAHCGINCTFEKRPCERVRLSDDGILLMTCSV